VEGESMKGTVKQKYRMVETGSLIPHPQNPRQGDVGAIVESIWANGFYGTVAFQKGTRLIIYGEHRWKAARIAGLEEVPGVEMDVDDATAVRIMLADNRSNDLASYDDSRLFEILKEQIGSDTLDGTLFGGDDVEELRRLLEGQEAQAAEEAEKSGGLMRRLDRGDTVSFVFGTIAAALRHAMTTIKARGTVHAVQSYRIGAVPRHAWELLQEGGAGGGGGLLFHDSGYAYKDRCRIRAPFPADLYLDAKAWEWLLGNVQSLPAPVTFWNVGGEWDPVTGLGKDLRGDGLVTPTRISDFV
jgi:hypothetical protein